MKKIKRIVLLDELRGLLVLLMIFYHLIYSMKYVVPVDIGVDLFSYKFLGIIQISVSSMFILISGFSSNKSRNILKRGLKLLGISIILSMATYLFMPSEFIAFGILHFLASAMIILFILKTLLGDDVLSKAKRPGMIGILFFILYVIMYNIPSGFIGIGELLTINVSDKFYMNGVTAIFGFPGGDFFSADYFPIFPYLMIFIAGAFFEYSQRNKVLPDFFYKSNCRLLEKMGKNSLTLYIIHQPIIIAMLYLLTMQ